MNKRYKGYARLLCPICGAKPKMNRLLHYPYEDDSIEQEYKVYCSGCSVHISCCDWKRTELEAWREWKRRRTDKNQPDFAYINNASKIFTGVTPWSLNLDSIADFLRKVQTGEFHLPDGVMFQFTKSGFFDSLPAR